MPYNPPLKNMLSALKSNGLSDLLSNEKFLDFDLDLIQQVLEEGAKYASEIVAPTNAKADREGTKLIGNEVIAAPILEKPYKTMVENGWQGISIEPEFGGMGLPKSVGLAFFEMLSSSNLAFSLAPILTSGAIDAILTHGNDAQKQEYLPKLVSGEWSGTMNLTESSAGSDLGSMTTKAIRNQDGSFNIIGQKIYITWGDHNYASNIIHLVLARIEGAPEGVKGISLFIVPKFLPDENNEYNIRNDVGVLGLEHKLGIHASPTCVMGFGQKLFGENGAKGFLIGSENKGLMAMFTMMNAARLYVGAQGMAIAELATQKAEDYAKERVQGKIYNQTSLEKLPIINHPDVKRMLLEMKAKTKIARLICYRTAIEADNANIKENAKEFEGFLTPIAKAYSTDIGSEVANLGIQVHGGMGFTEDCEAAQFLRDVRITQIYEGTNGIQAIDLIGRKMALDNGATFKNFVGEIKAFLSKTEITNPKLNDRLELLNNATNCLLEIGEHIIACQNSNNTGNALFKANSFLRMAAEIIGSYLLIKEICFEEESGEKALNSICLLDFICDNYIQSHINNSKDFIGLNAEKYDYDFN